MSAESYKKIEKKSFENIFGLKYFQMIFQSFQIYNNKDMHLVISKKTEELSHNLYTVKSIISMN